MTADPTDGRSRAGLTSAEACASAVLAFPLTLVLGAFLADLAGLPFPPGPMLVVALGASGATLARLRRGSVRARADLVAWLGVVVAMWVWLVWLSWPTLLPLSSGPDLTHHLQLIRYLETHWRLVHDHSVERFLGEMAQYTPGSQLLAAFGGAWTGTDGLRVLHPMLAATVALKAGFLLLIALRLQPRDIPRVPVAVCAILLSFAAPRYLLGSFTEYGFVAQVVAELFVVAMWWVAVAWDASPSFPLGVLFSVAGAAAFLTWPVYTGPPALAFGLVVALHRGMRARDRLRHLTVAFGPFGLIALVYLAGRLGWLQMAGTGGDAPWPTVAAYGWPLVGLAGCGLAASVLTPRGRPTAIFTAAVLAQAAALYVLARRSGAAQPYMALKMCYLLLWPMCALAALAIGHAWRAARQSTRRIGRMLPAWLVREPLMAWGLSIVVAVAAIRPLVQAPVLLHPRPPSVSAPLYEAGRWARANIPPACVEYLVADDETAYWLHLAVLGNPRMSARTGDNATYELNDALLRWLTPNGLPFAIAEWPALPRGVREELDVMARFESAAVVRRRGPSTCAGEP